MKSIDGMKEIFLDLSEQNKPLLNTQEDIEKLIVVDNPYAGLLETFLKHYYTSLLTEHITVVI